MDLVLKGRGGPIPQPIRDGAQAKLGKLARLEPRALRLELVFTSEHNPRLDGAVRVEGTLVAPRKTFRAHAQDHEPEVALDKALARLERQVREHHAKRRSRLFAWGDRLKSERPPPGETAD